MRLALCAATLVAALVSPGLASPARAQDVPRGTLAAGYSYLRSDEESFHGWDAAVTWTLRGWLGLEADLSGHYATVEGTDIRTLSLLAGPRFARHGTTVTPFLHALVGGVRSRGSISLLGITISETDTNLGGAFGGGVDFDRGRRWGVRVQADYRVVRVDAENEGDPRGVAAVTYRFGSR